MRCLERVRVTAVAKAWACERPPRWLSRPEELCRDLHLHSEEEASAGEGQAWVVPPLSGFVATSHPISLARGQVARQVLSPPLQDALLGRSPTKAVTTAPPGSHIFPPQPHLLLQSRGPSR